MSDDYILRPIEKEFSAETLRRAREYWDARPNYKRSDGAIMSVATQEEADRAVRDHITEFPWPSSLAIVLDAKKVILGTLGTDRDAELYRFAEWLYRVQPFRVTDDFAREKSLEWLRKQLASDET